MFAVLNREFLRKEFICRNIFWKKKMRIPSENGAKKENKKLTCGRCINIPTAPKWSKQLSSSQRHTVYIYICVWADVHTEKMYIERGNC